MNNGGRFRRSRVARIEAADDTKSVRVCAECGDEFEGVTRARFCSDGCKKRNNAERMRAVRAEQAKAKARTQKRARVRA